MTKIAKSLGLLALMYSVAAVAQVSHVSINSRMFELGTYPKMRLNVITDNQDMTRLEFVVHQSTGEEKLMAQPLNRFLVLLTGVEDITDPKAQLLVREYRIDRWHKVKSLPLFGTDKASEPLAVEPKLNPNPAVKATQTVKPAGGNTAKIANAGAALTAVAPTATPVAHTDTVSTATINIDTTTTNTASSTKVQSTLMHSASAPDAKPSVSTAWASDKCVLNYAANETLWRIATRYAAEWEVNIYSAMLAIYDANPKAFYKNKINALMKNATLYCPSKDLLVRYADAEEAKAIFEAK